MIVGVVLVGALNVVGSSAQTNRVAATKLDAPHLGHQLMGEVLALPYEDPEAPGMPIGPDAGESTVTRSDFDDLDDYAGWDQTPPQAKDGTPIPNASGWRREVFINYFDPATGGTTATDTGVKLIRVKVSPPSGSSLELEAIRSRWGALEQDSAIDTTLVNSLDGTLQIGSSGLPARSAALLPNHANAP